MVLVSLEHVDPSRHCECGLCRAAVHLTLRFHRTVRDLYEEILDLHPAFTPAEIACSYEQTKEEVSAGHSPAQEGSNKSK